MKLRSFSMLGFVALTSLLLASCNPDNGGETGDGGDEVTTYVVSFDTGGGTTIPSQNVEEGKTASLPSIEPTLEGYTFLGWYTSANGNTEFDFTTVINQDTTVYAHYEVDVIIDVPEDEKTLYLGIDETYQLHFDALANQVARNEITWVVGDDTIISINDEGLITALKEGTTSLSIVSNLDETNKEVIAVNVGKVLWDGKDVLAKPSMYHLDEENKTVDLLNVDAFIYFRHLVNSGNQFVDYTVNLLVDINLGGYDFAPIGASTRSGFNVVGDNIFKGTFNGHNNTIINLSIINDTNAYALGLFSGLDGTVIQNLNITHARIKADKNTQGSGILAGVGANSFVIRNVKTDGFISGYQGVGGILGRALATGTIENSTNYGNVTTVTGGYNTGGIVGAMYYDQDPTMTLDINDRLPFMVKESRNYGTVSGIVVVGGIVGLATTASVLDSINYGEIYASTGDSIGGIVGGMKNGGTIEGSLNEGDIFVSEQNQGRYGVGGLIGWVRYDTSATYNQKMIATILSSTNTGEVNSAGTRGVAGLVGSVYWSVIIEDSSNSGNVSNIHGIATGGIIGNIQYSADNHSAERDDVIKVNNVHSTALKVDSLGQNLGTVIGHFYLDASLEIEISFNDVTALPIPGLSTGLEVLN